MWIRLFLSNPTQSYVKPFFNGVSAALGTLECSQVWTLWGCSTGRKWFGCDRSIFKGKKKILLALNDIVYPRMKRYNIAILSSKNIEIKMFKRQGCYEYISNGIAMHSPVR